MAFKLSVLGLRVQGGKVSGFLGRQGSEFGSGSSVCVVRIAGCGSRTLSFKDPCDPSTTVWCLVGNGGMDCGGHYWGLYRDCKRDPYPHSQLRTRQFKKRMLEESDGRLLSYMPPVCLSWAFEFETFGVLELIGFTLNPKP